MPVFPTTKTVPLTKDIGVLNPKSRIGTTDREDLESVLTAIDQTLASIESAAALSLSGEVQNRIDADQSLQDQIDAEVIARTDAVSAEEIRALAAEAAEILTRSTQDDILQQEIDHERFPLRLYSVSGTTVSVAAATTTRLDSSGNAVETIALPNSSTVADFSGATIDFASGSIIYAVGGPAASTFEVPSTTGMGTLWMKYAIVLLPTSPNTLLIIQAESFGATRQLAPDPFFSGGIPIGVVAVQVNDLGTGWNNVQQQHLTQLLASGGADNAGTAASILDPNPEDTFVYYTRSDFGVDGKVHLDSTSGTDMILGLKKVVMSASDTLLTKTLSGSQVRSDALPINAAQAHVLYMAEHVDESPEIELSRDGGSTWESASVYLPGSETQAKYQGNMVMADLAFPDSNLPVISGGDPNGTTNSGQKVAAIFTPSYTMTVNSFDAYVKTTSTTGAVSGKIMTVSTGMPSLDLSSSSASYSALTDIGAVAGYKNFAFSPVTLIAGEAYALVVEGSDLNGNVVIESTSGASSDNNSSATNAGFGWTASGNKLSFKLYGTGCDLKMRITASASCEVAGFGVNYVSNLTSDQNLKIPSFYDAIVGPASYVDSGLATHLSLSSAVADTSAGGTILVLSGTYSENIVVSKTLTILGHGHGTNINGNVTLSSNYSTLKNVRVAGNLSVTGSGNFVKECFAASSSTITDTGTANKKEIIQE